MEVAIPLVFLLENSFSGENNRIDFEIRFNIKTPGRVKFVAWLKKYFSKLESNNRGYLEWREKAIYHQVNTDNI